MANKPAVDVNAVVAAVLAAMQQAAPVAVTKAAKAAPAPADISGIAKAMSSGSVEVRTSVKGKPFACVKFEYAGRAQVANIWL